MDARGLRQEDMAKRTGVSQGAVSGWLNDAVPKGDVLLRLARSLGVSMEYLLTGEYDSHDAAPFVVAESTNPDLDLVFEKIEKARLALDEVERALKKARR